MLVADKIKMVLQIARIFVNNEEHKWTKIQLKMAKTQQKRKIHLPQNEQNDRHQIYT